MIKNKLHQRRWDSAKVLFNRLKDKADCSKCDIIFDSTIIGPEQIVITDDEIYVHIDYIRYVQFVANSNYDEGCYCTITKYRQEAKELFKLVKIVDW